MKHGKRGNEVEAAEAFERRARFRHFEGDVAQTGRIRPCPRVRDGDRRQVEAQEPGDMRREVALDRAVAATEAEDAVRAAGAGRVQELTRAALVHAAEELAALDPGRVGFIVVVVVVALVHRLFSRHAARRKPPAAAAPSRSQSERRPRSK